MDWEKVERLRDLALRATSIDWASDGSRVVALLNDGTLVADTPCASDTDYIAAADPRTMLELIGDYEAACRVLCNLAGAGIFSDVKEELMEAMRMEAETWEKRS